MVTVSNCPSVELRSSSTCNDGCHVISEPELPLFADGERRSPLLRDSIPVWDAIQTNSRIMETDADLIKFRNVHYSGDRGFGRIIRRINDLPEEEGR